MEMLQFLANVILFITMLLIGWQAQTAYKEYKAKNKPVVGIESTRVTLLIPDGDPRIGKPVLWDKSKNGFICEGNPVEAQGCIIEVRIKNFGTEPALDFNFDEELLIGNTSIKTADPEFKNCIIMPGQMMASFPRISKQDLQDAFLRGKQIKLKHKFIYSDLTRKNKMFEYFAEVLVVSENVINPRVVNSSFIDKRA